MPRKRPQPNEPHEQNASVSIEHQPGLDRLLSVEDVATKLGVKPETVLDWSRVGIARGGALVKLKALRFGRQCRFQEADVITFGRALGELSEPVRQRRRHRRSPTG